MTRNHHNLLVSQHDWFAHLLAALRIHLSEIDRRCGKNETVFTAEASRAVVVLRRVVIALEERMSELKRLEADDNVDEARVLDVTQRPLVLSANPLHALVSEPPIPPIAVDALAESINRLLRLVQPERALVRRSAG